LLALGLYTALVEGIGNLDFGAILPLAVGAVVGVLAFAKLMDHFFRNNRKSTYCVIFGLTLGSVITVVIEAVSQMESGQEYLIPCIIAVVAGLVLGYGMHMLTRYIRGKNAATEEQAL
jgi:putative membrane protein